MFFSSKLALGLLYSGTKFRFRLDEVGFGVHVFGVRSSRSVHRHPEKQETRAYYM